MEQNIPEEIARSREMLGVFSKAPVLEKAMIAHRFADAFNLLESFRRANPCSAYEALIANLKNTSTKELILNLREMSDLNVDFAQWSNVAWLLMTCCKDEVTVIIRDDPSLKRIYDDFWYFPYVKDLLATLEAIAKTK